MKCHEEFKNGIEEGHIRDELKWLGMCLAEIGELKRMMRDG